VQLVKPAPSACSTNKMNAELVIGPSITFYTAAYGGLEALSHAYENLIAKRIDGAIVGSSASHVDPKLSINYQLMGYLSPDGRTKVFDANGMFRLISSDYENGNVFLRTWRNALYNYYCYIKSYQDPASNICK